MEVRTPKNESCIPRIPLCEPSRNPNLNFFFFQFSKWVFKFWREWFFGSLQIFWKQGLINCLINRWKFSNYKKIPGLEWSWAQIFANEWDCVHCNRQDKTQAQWIPARWFDRGAWDHPGLQLLWDEMRNWILTSHKAHLGSKRRLSGPTRKRPEDRKWPSQGKSSKDPAWLKWVKWDN